MTLFPTGIDQIQQRIDQIDPKEYSATRNYKGGAVTRLSPYISRGVISTKQVYYHLKNSNIAWNTAEKLVQELAWRDYWQQVWIAKKEQIFKDLKHPQQQVQNHKIPKAVVDANTGIHAVDKAILQLYKTGYMHNHMRMYVASLCCNIAKCHWLEPAKWLFHHLLDGDIASNHLSWQWVAGSNSNKKYYANQDNINKFFYSDQKNTFIDVEYEHFDELDTPEQLKVLTVGPEKTPLATDETAQLEPNKTTLIYNYYNIDDQWHKHEDVQRVLLLEPSIFKKHPVSSRCIDFSLALSKNIKGIRLFVGEFHELAQILTPEYIKYKEHPLNQHYLGTEEPREWLSTVTGYFPSFFAFWKKCKTELKWE